MEAELRVGMLLRGKISKSIYEVMSLDGKGNVTLRMALAVGPSENHADVSRSRAITGLGNMEPVPLIGMKVKCIKRWVDWREDCVGKEGTVTLHWSNPNAWHGIMFEGMRYGKGLPKGQNFFEYFSLVSADAVVPEAKPKAEVVKAPEPLPRGRTAGIAYNGTGVRVETSGEIGGIGPVYGAMDLSRSEVVMSKDLQAMIDKQKKVGRDYKGYLIGPMGVKP